jgi:hypothetical protein
MKRELKPHEKAAKTAKWAVCMTKVRIRQIASKTRWQLVTFLGENRGESRGVVDLLAVRKDHRRDIAETKRGDALELILIQVKGGSAPEPTEEDWKRLRAVKKLHGAKTVLLAKWKKGRQVEFYPPGRRTPIEDQEELAAIFR